MLGEECVQVVHVVRFNCVRNAPCQRDPTCQGDAREFSSGGGGLMPDEVAAPEQYDDELTYLGGGLPKTTNWWGAFVIGLAGTILVTGIAPATVTTLGAASIPLIVVIVITGYILCLLLAVLSAMMPARAGAAPSYAYAAYREKSPGCAK